MSRKLLLCTVASAALLTSPVLAADLPVKALHAPLPTWSWAGFYIGGHAGYGWKENDFSEVISVVPLVTLDGINSKGWVAGGQAGYNWQYGRWVAGLEVDGSATEVRGTSTPIVRNFAGGISLTDTAADDVKYLGTVRARVGGAIPFANTDVLLYGTAGLAWERLHRTDSTVLVVPGTTQVASTVAPRDHFGWVAGVGGEVRLGATNWIGRVEYLHYDFGTVEAATSVTTTPAVPGGTFADRAGRQTIDVVRAGLSYKFDGTASPFNAYAASMPVKAAAPLAWSWAGFYIGGHGGYGWKENDFSDVISVVPLQTLGGINSSGWVAGGQAGYNWQFGRWVAGLEMDGSATQIRGTSTPLVRNFAGGISITDAEGDDVKYLGTVRARVGGAIPFANTDVLLYGTAGLAWERVNRIDSTVLVVPGSTQTVTNVTPRDHFGWVAGVGGEVRLGATNWIGRIEYLHYDFGTVEATTAVTTTPATPGGTFADQAGRQTIDVVRAGLSYKFSPTSSPLSAYAADMPLKAVAPVLAWNWAGFYIGGHGGYGWKENDFSEVISVIPLQTLGGINSSGWVAGGQAGYNWQYGRWVAGFEVDGSATEVRGTSTPIVRNFAGGISITDTAGDDVKYLGTVRTRVGGAIPFANTDVLFYGTAGLAWERLHRTDSTVLVVPGSTQVATTVRPRDHFGWVAGVGAEVRLGATNWIGRIEYLHYDFGTVEPVTIVNTVPATPGGSFSDQAGRQTIDVVRAGLSYKFAATP